MTLKKVEYPGPGCIVEFMHGNSPLLAVVLEEQNGRLRLYTKNKREQSLPAQRLLPWSGPCYSGELSRQAMDELLAEHAALRQELIAAVNFSDAWELVQGEMETVSAGWLSGLLWNSPTIDHEAALGNLLLSQKMHFRFQPPDFEVFTALEVARRLAEAESAAKREGIIARGTVFFQALWDIHCRKRKALMPEEELDAVYAGELRELLLTKLSEICTPEGEQLWRQMVKGLPDVPFLPLHLAVAWEIIPEHYNFHLDRIHYQRGNSWAKSYSKDCVAVLDRYNSLLDDSTIPLCNDSFVTIDPAMTKDRDDAFYVEPLPNGSFAVSVAIACPAISWGFGTALDKEIAHRFTSMYFPEGDEHMLPPAIGWEMCGLDAGQKRLGIVLKAVISDDGTVHDMDLCLCKIKVAQNFSLEESEQYLTQLCQLEADELAENESDAALALALSGQQDIADSCGDDDFSIDSAEKPEVDGHVQPRLSCLESACRLAKILRKKRIQGGAVITERPDAHITLDHNAAGTFVQVEEAPPTPRSHLIIGELMILANMLVGEWAHAQELPLFYRTQDVALPKEFTGIWNNPHEISRVVRALPPAIIETRPKRHAGLGVSVYTSYTSPIRRYLDLVNQAQICSALAGREPFFTQQDLDDLLPVFSARNDSASQVQRSRPRYWKLVFFRQQGDKKWWQGTVVEETPHFVTVALPWAQIFVRGKRSLFNDKLALGQAIHVRIGKVRPLLNEIAIVEAQV